MTKHDAKSFSSMTHNHPNLIFYICLFLSPENIALLQCQSATKLLWYIGSSRKVKIMKS